MASSSAPRLSSSTTRARASDRLIFGAVGAAGIASAALLLWLLGNPLFAGTFLAIFLSVAGLLVLGAHLWKRTPAAHAGNDWALMRAIGEDASQAVAVTDRAGRIVCANESFSDWFEGMPTPPSLPFAGDGPERLANAGRTAWRDGTASLAGLRLDRGLYDAEIVRAGQAEDHLVWRVRRSDQHDPVADVSRQIEGDLGQRLDGAGVMAVLVDSEGRLVAANRSFLRRAFGRIEVRPAGRPLVDLLRTGADDYIRLAVDDDEADPLRLLQIPLFEDQPDSPVVFLMLDEDGSASARPGVRSTATVHVHGLLAMLPLGLALAERDGRFLFMNEAFLRAAGISPEESVIYPGDLVVKEDKAAVSDAVRRFASGQSVSGDVAVRLRHRPEEPVTLTIAGAKGLGDAAVLLSLKDNSEESRLKRQIAQATKMQAVGQLAGGVAQDFNNILTAIIGHCDLMLMRHTPGDSDYDDIHQIRSNSNRAAGLTRQLLAFSRQQTLRPQILQLPDVISEVSNLLNRLLGETVTLVVKHGRNLGAVRADPGQLEQVIVNLSVNARDAMPDGGTVTLQTYAVSADDVRDLGTDILPIGDYTALSVSDTGVGIPPEILGKVFEPFFTTKEVGKGTGLGLSTVYGIVKQTGGFIFADSELGKGTSFVIYLPVHRVEPSEEAPVVAHAPKAEELWGSGTILLVEDEDMVRAVAERALTRQGYHVVPASNGEVALELIESGAESFDLLVSDVVMPSMDGPTLVRKVRERFPDLPILFMSGYAEEQLRRSIDIDRVSFLAKPFSVQQLAQAVRDTLAGKRL